MRSSAERNGEIQLGVDHARQIAGLPRDRRLVVWGSWVDNPGYAAWLFGLADKHHLRKMGENSGGGTNQAGLQAAIFDARSYKLSALFWVRNYRPNCNCGRRVLLAGFARLIHLPSRRLAFR